MAESLISDGASLNVKNIKFGTPKVNAKGGKQVKLLDENGNNLAINTPFMLNWGVNTIVDDKSGATSYNISLQFPNGGGDDECAAFLTAMKDLEDKVIKAAIENSKDWLNKPKMSEEVARELFSPILRYPQNKDTKEPDHTRAPTLKVKLQCWDSKFTCEIYDLEENALYAPKGHFAKSPVELIEKGSYIAAIIQCGGIYFIGNKFGISWNLAQCVVRPPMRIADRCLVRVNKHKVAKIEAEAKAGKYAMEEEPSFDDDVPTSSMSKMKVAAEPVNTQVDDSDDEGARVVDDDDDDDDDTPAPAPKVEEKKAAPVVKKVVKKVTKA